MVKKSWNNSGIDARIQKAETLPSSFYFDEQAYEDMKEVVFGGSWHMIGKKDDLLIGDTSTVPFTLYDKFLSEPLLLTKDEKGHIRCISNVCTHRAFLLGHHPSNQKKITCAYHGRRFALDGTMEFMPEFKTAEDFPRPCDHLANLPLKEWEGFLFASLQPTISFDDIVKTLDERLSFLDIANFRYAPEYDKIYNVHAHWALYCDNYLEGFHIPFVHNKLGAMIDYGSYETICYEHMNVQIGYSKGGTPSFDLPEGHIDYGKKVSAYYYWIFPNLMLNIYPWGLQINVVEPITSSFTKVYFYHYIKDESMWQLMEGEDIAEKTQREDEWVVEGVQKGLRSRFYDTGRFSPTREQGVHHFHSLLQKYLQKS